jgi:phage regulator Rha-like protein
MMQLSIGATPTMTSLEIAELTGKQHKHVLTDIKNMLAELGLESSGFSDDYTDPRGRSQPCYRLPKRETLILVSGYSTPMRSRIIDRWQELETRIPAELSEIEVARRYLVVLEEREVLKKRIASSTLYPKGVVEPGWESISLRSIKSEYFPAFAEPKIRLILRFYGQGLTPFQFGAHENACLTTFRRQGIEEVVDRFWADATVRISSSGLSLIVEHECFDAETPRAVALAVRYLGYTEESFRRTAWEDWETGVPE